MEKEVLAADNEEREYLELGPEKQLNEVRVVLIVDWDFQILEMPRMM